MNARSPSAAIAGRALLALFYVVAGVVHLWHPQPFVAVTPAWVPEPLLVVRATGVAELLGAAGLLIARTRRLAGTMLALYAVCVFPANIQHAVRDLGAGTGLPWAYHAPRLFAQPFIMWWALWAGGIVGRRRS